MTAGGQTIPFQWAGHQNYLGRRYCTCNDVERTLHQHHEIWCTLDPRRPVEIAWTIDEEKQRLRLVWTEKGGPAVEPPTRRSFGTRMMESLGQQLNGQVRLAYEPSGFIYALDVPLGWLIAAV